MPSTCVFIKTWPNDLKWLRYCLDFLAKNWQERETEIVIVADRDCRSAFQGYQMQQRERLVLINPWPDGYSHAMWVKANADNYTNCELILFMDSDVMLVEPAITETFLDDGKPILLYQPYDKFMLKHPNAPWKRIVDRLMGVKVPNYHTFLPFMCWADTLRKTRAYITRKHRWAAESIAYSDKPFDFTQFNDHPITWADHETIGAFAHMMEAERYSFLEFEETRRVAPWHTEQFHSWTQWGKDTEAKLKKMLGKYEPSPEADTGSTELA